MDDRQKQMLKLEQDASRLVDELGELKGAVSVFRAAAHELEQTRSALVGFLDETQKLTKQTHKLIATINEIGSAKIFNQLAAIEIALAENAKKEAKRNLLLAIGVSVVIVLQVVILVIVMGGR